MTVGVLFAFMNYHSQFFININTITDSILQLKSDKASIDHVLEILDMQRIKKLRVKIKGSSLVVENLVFRYNDKQNFVVNGITFGVDEKEHAGVVGRSR